MAETEEKTLEVTDQDPVQEAAQVSEAEAKATDMGWVPQDQWKGNPDAWRPAEEFVQRGENILPIVKDRLSKAENDLKMLLASQKQFEKRITEEANAKAQASYEKRVKELDKRELEAFNNADTEEYLAAKNERAQLQPPVLETVDEAPAQTTNPEFVEWESKNAWYQDDAVLRRNADIIAEEVWAANPNMAAKELYAKVEARVKEEFSHKFTNPKREEAAAVDSGSGTSTKQSNRFEDLPAAAKTQFSRLEARMKANGREYSKADFVAAYNE